MKINLAGEPRELVSVVILSWNREKDLRGTLINFQKQKYFPIEIIVVDNDSQDQSVSMVRRDFPQVKLLQLPKNIGMAAVNKGIEKANGQYLYISDNDAYPEVDAISQAVERFRTNKDLGICAFKTINLHSGVYPELAFEKGKTIEEKIKGIEVRKFCGCGVMTRKKVLDEIGGYPSDYFWCGEEADIAMRVIHAGYEVRYFPELIVYHMKSPVNRSSAQRMYYETRNLLWLYWRFSPVFMAFLKSAYTLVDLGIKSIKNNNIRNYTRGMVDGIMGLPAVFSQRQIVYNQTLGFQFNELTSKWLRRRARLGQVDQTDITDS